MAIKIEYLSNVETVAVPSNAERIPVSDEDIAFIEEWLQDAPTKPECLSMEDLRQMLAQKLKGNP